MTQREIPPHSKVKSTQVAQSTLVGLSRGSLYPGDENSRRKNNCQDLLSAAGGWDREGPVELTPRYTGSTYKMTSERMLTA